MHRVLNGPTMLVALMAAARETTQATRPTRPAPWNSQPTQAPADSDRIRRYLETGAGSVCRAGKASNAR